MNIDPNGPAFPLPIFLNGQPKQNVAGTTGLSIRAEIAARIMAGFAANADSPESPKYDAKHAVKWTDALILELNKTNQ